VELEATAFHAVALAPSGGRAAVRDWVDTTVAEAQRSIAHWFELQRIVGAAGEEPTPLGLYALALATVRDARDLPVTTPRALLRAAVTGTPAPRSLLSEALRRNHAEQRITRARAALIKLVLQSDSHPPKEEYLVNLEAPHPSPAYHCGRLLAVIEAVQRAALPGVNATVIDRFFGTASTAPGLVFPRLLRGAQPHLSKLERDRRGAYVALQRQLEETLSHVDSFPNALSMEDQGLFSLGYYHQRATDRAQVNARRKPGDAHHDDLKTTAPEED
jgi:CRISPR-associated protein Csd1